MFLEKIERIVSPNHDLVFIVKDLLQSLENGEISAFLWESVMLSPTNVKQIGVIHTPWPCFCLAASTSYVKNHFSALREFVRVLRNELAFQGRGVGGESCSGELRA